jgi:phytoene dehydrogenase-like protein
MSPTVLSLLLLFLLKARASAFANAPREHSRRRLRLQAITRTDAPRSSSAMTSNPLEDMRDEYDVIVVGSGIGGLSAAAMLSLYGNSVAVMESHYAPGGSAHGYSVKHATGTYQFDTGPSFFSGLNPDFPAKSSNPLRTVLDAIGEQVECVPYTTFGLNFPEGSLLHTANFGGHNSASGVRSKDRSPLEQIAGPKATQEWMRLMQAMKPLAKAVEAMPTAALRGDLSALVTAAPFLKNFATLNPLENLKLTRPFSDIIDQANVQTQFTRNWLDLLCFCLSGMPANGTITAEMAMMMGEFYDENAVMDCPKGGANAIAHALVRGIQKHGGQVFCKSHVDSILISSEQDNRKRATGIRLKKNGRVVRAKRAVISNLSIWDLLNNGILDTSALPASFVEQGQATPIGKSFMHLHLGFRATPEELQKLQAHYIHIDDWSIGVEAPDNAVLVSIPSVHDDSLAPPGFAVLHAYTPATEDYAPWARFKDKRTSSDYEQFKQERSQYLWETLEKIIPDIRERATVVQVGTPLTHERFLRRYKGSYGPAIVAGQGSFPFPKTGLSGFLCCGDSCFPGIGALIGFCMLLNCCQSRYL